MSYAKTRSAELTKAKVDKKMGAAMSGAGASESQVQEAKESVRVGRNSGPQGVHTEPGNFQEKKSVATSSSKINTTDQKSIKPNLEKARVDEGKPPEEKVKDRSARNSRFPKKWENPKAKEGDFAGKPRSNAETQSGVHESPGSYKKGSTGSFRDGGGKKDKIDHQASHSMVKQGLKNTNPKLPDVKKSSVDMPSKGESVTHQRHGKGQVMEHDEHDNQTKVNFGGNDHSWVKSDELHGYGHLSAPKPKSPMSKSEFKAGMSYDDIKKMELEKGIFHDTMAGISLGATMLAVGTAHQDKQLAHMPLGHVELHDTGGQSSEQEDPTRRPASITAEKIQTVKQKIKDIRSKIKPAKGQE